MKKKVIVSVTNDLYTDQRVSKVCNFLQENGFDITLLGRRKKDSLPLPEKPYQTKRFKLMFENGALFYAMYNIRLFFYLLFHKADVLVSNDLDTLLANSMAKKFKNNCTLIYDSHEYFTEVPELVNRPKVQAIWKWIEGKHFRNADQVITVNESIAELYRKEYNREIHVIRNISKRWNPENIQSKLELGIPEDKNLIILQGAGINIDRGAEELIESMPNVDAVLLIVGDGDVLQQLKNRVNELNIAEKVLFFGKKPYNVMMNYTYHADIGVTLDKDTNLNYKFSLPNKVFDYMHTNTCVVATNIKEVERVVTKYKLGEIVDPLTPKILELTINNIFLNQEKLMEYKSNCKIASQTENWEYEKEKLKVIYNVTEQ